jgi:SAM-dependent methyltransferase
MFISFASRFQNFLYKLIAGSHPRTNIFHHQWAMNRQLLKFSKQRLKQIPIGAEVLDVGVGSAPYWYLRPDLKWTGLDVIDGPNVDFVIAKDFTWPIPNQSIDYIFCTQVIEHVENPESLVSEIERVLIPGGTVILNAPFFYPFHGMPDDHLRYTTSQLNYLFRKFNISECGILGGVGSSVATILLNFTNYQISQSTFLKTCHVFLFPLWLFWNATINLGFVLIDKFDKTNSFPLNTFLIANSYQQPKNQRPHRPN